MAHTRFRSLAFFFIALGLTTVSSMPAYGQRVWTLVSSDFKGRSLQFPSVDTGYALAIDPKTDDDSVIRTTDGGHSWNPVNLPIPHFPQSYIWTNMTFCGNLGWIETLDVDSLPPTGKFPQTGSLLRTTDYGFSWAVLPIDSLWQTEGVYFKSPSLGYIWGNNGVDSNFFDISTDSGRTWQPRTVPGNGVIAATVGQPNVIFGEATFGQVDPSIAQVVLSTDSGATWVGYDGPPMSYIGSNTWVSYNAWSTDNGKTWDTVPTTAQLNGVFTDTLGHGMFSGYDGTQQGQFKYDSTLYFTNDYGHSWDSVKVPFSKIASAAIIGNVWYAQTIDSGGSNPSLYRSVLATSYVSQTTPPTTFRILTNPATHVLELSLEEIPDDIRIVDFLGRTVGQYATQGGAFSVDVSALPAGLYWVVTHSGAKAFVHLDE